MTYRVGACASPSSGKAMAEYYLAGTLKAEPARAAEYYTGAEAREERAAEFWRGAVREGHCRGRHGRRAAARPLAGLGRTPRHRRSRPAIDPGRYCEFAECDTA